MGPVLSQERCDRARRLTEVYSQDTILELTGLGSSQLWRLKKRGWKAIPKGFRQRPRPSDFAIQVRHMTVLELARHYRTSNSIVARWKRELGIPYRAPCIGRRG